MNKPRKKNIVAVLAGVAVAAAVTASAASLGGISTEWLGANSNVVASPITGGLSITWDTAYSSTAGHYIVTDFELDTIDDSETLPEGADIQLALQLTGAKVAEFEGTIGSGGSVDFDGTFPVIAAHDVEGVSVVLIGGGKVAAADLP